jgi:hypothetical protein
LNRQIGKQAPRRLPEVWSDWTPSGEAIRKRSGREQTKGNFFRELKEKFLRIARKSRLRLVFQTEALRRLLTVSMLCSIKILRNSPSFQQSIDHGPFSIELHAWRSAESCTFATFIYEKAGQRLLRHFTGSDENKVIRQARVWCDENS